jgi:hypothetical protein
MLINGAGPGIFRLFFWASGNPTKAKKMGS